MTVHPRWTWARPDGAQVVAEPGGKDLLAAHGVRTPRRVVATCAGDLARRAGDLQAPLVLKAFGTGILHKTELGAVAMGLSHAEVPAAAQAMLGRLESRGITAAGLLCEEQAPSGLELLVGAVRRDPFGTVIVVGAGGTHADLVADVATRLFPLDRADAEGMVDELRCAPLLDGYRGGQAADRVALVDVLMAVGGPGGVVDELGGTLRELDCNPVRVSPGGAEVLDVRLVVDPAVPAPEAPSPLAMDALLRPKTIAVAGASTTRPSFGNRALAAYRAMGWDEGLYALHPAAAEVDGVPAVDSLGSVDGGVDYLLVAVPAPVCVDVVRDHGRHARVVHVLSGGFSEAGPEGAALEDALVAAARGAGVRLVGPNCIGAYGPAGRQTFQLDVPHEPGGVGVVSQSGGLAGDVIRLGARRGLRFSGVVSVGNGADVAAGELLDHLVDDSATALLGVYLEGPRDGARVVQALGRARGRVPVVVLCGGTSSLGSRAASSHTGSLTGDEDLWRAIAARTGATVVRDLDDLIGCLSYLDRYLAHPASAGASTVVLGPGGGASVLAADAADRAGLSLAPLVDAAVAELRAAGFGAGTSLANPLEVAIGPAAPADTFTRVLDIVVAHQPVADVVVHVNVSSYYGYGRDGVGHLCQVVEHLAAGSWPARLALVVRGLDAAPADDAAAVTAAVAGAGIPWFRRLGDATTAVAAMQRFDRDRTAAARQVDGAG